LPRLQAGAPPLRFTLVTPNATPTPHGGIRVMALTIPAQTSQPLMMGDLGRQHAGCAASSQAQGVLQKALGLYRAGKTDEAIRSIKNALMDAPKNALLWAGLAELRIAEKDFASASEAFGRALRLEPSKEQWASRYATLLPKAMGGAAAVEALNQLAETHPNNATVLATLGALLQERGLAEQARPVLEKALALTPQDASCHYNLALALEQTGHAQDALRHYQTALNLAPRFENARLAVARLKGSS
jgi:tetratricopeptide (TPR) repeat protein